MIKKIVCFLTILFAPFVAHAADTYSVDELLQRNPDSTKCATAVFADALRATVDTLKNTGAPDEQAPQDADGTEIDTWIHLAFSMPATLNKILECPEVKNAADNDTIVFETVSYIFPNGRIIDVNYETQKSILKQKLLLATKPKLTTDDISPDIVADAANGTVWVNVDPAWYAILVTEHGALSDYVAPGKTNVVALRYLKDNIKSLYPRNRRCTSRSAIAGDKIIISSQPPMHIAFCDCRGRRRDKSRGHTHGWRWTAAGCGNLRRRTRTTKNRRKQRLLCLWRCRFTMDYRAGGCRRCCFNRRHIWWI